MTMRSTFSVQFVILAVAYFLTGWLGLQIPSVGTQITLIWLPTGIAVGSLFLWGWRLWPAIYLAAFGVNFIIGGDWRLAAGIAVGNTLAPLITYGLLRWLDFRLGFQNKRAVGVFILSAGVGMAASATLGVLNLVLSGRLPPTDLGEAGLTWWMGDTVGVLLAAPVLLTCSHQSVRQLWQNRWNLTLWLLLALPMAWLAFFYDFGQTSISQNMAFLTLPLFAWSALQFGKFGSALTGLCFALIAAWGASLGLGCFVSATPQVSLILLWGYIATIVMTGLMITALLSERERIESVLRENELKLRGLYELSPIGIVLNNLDGRFIEFNESFVAMTGYTSDELKSLDYWALTPSRYQDDEARQLESLRSTGRYGPYEKEYITKSGKLIPIQLSGVLVTLSDGVSYIWSMVENIAARKQAEAELIAARETASTRLGAIVEFAEDGIITNTLDGTITNWNPAAERIFGYAAEEMIGRRMQAMIPPELADEENTLLTQISLGGSLNHFETRRIRKDGQIIDISISISPIKDNKGEIIGASTFARDITANKKITEELRLAKEFAEAANRAKSAFVANMSHEIRTPLNAIIGLSGMMQRRTKDSANGNEAEKIVQSGKHLLGIVNDILDFSKIESGKLDLHQVVFSLPSLVDGAYSKMAVSAEAKQIRLEVFVDPELPVHVVGDAVRIEQCILNFLNNAVKFTDRGHIKLRVIKASSVPESQDIMVRFEVEDSGIGIPEDVQKRLFSDFQQADSSTSRKFGGTGLGLAITRKLAELMGGSAGLKSTLGQGSTFWFEAVLRLPLAAECAAADLTALAVDQQQRDLSEHYGGSRILLVEDNTINRDILLDMLGDVGLTADVAANGQDALQAVQSRPFDLILMDMQMPVMDGLQATRLIRESRDQSSLPIIALTANAYAEDRMDCLDAGMNDHLGKPILPEVLYPMLLKWLKPKSGESPMPVQSQTGFELIQTCLQGLGDIDLSKIQMAENKPDRYIRYFKAFRSDFKDVASRFRQFIGEGHHEDASRTMHSLKGSSAQLGIVGIENLAANVERAVISGVATDKILEQVNVLDKRLAVICAAISRFPD